MLKKVPLLSNIITFISKLLNNKIDNDYKHLIKDYTTQDISFYSSHIPFLILKHSERCIVSRTVMKDFMKFYKYNPDRFFYIVVDVVDNKSLSNSIAKEYKVIHQSPQVLLIKNGNCIYNESHNKINFNMIDNNF
jgi:bacillithiol system protein YtxJ